MWERARNYLANAASVLADRGETTASIDLWGTRCVRCGSRHLEILETPESTAIHRGAITCEHCRAEYDVVWGVPFLGSYEIQDFLGLFEIIANVEDSVPSPETVRRLDKLLSSYHHAADKRALVESSTDVMLSAPWFINRYREWLQMAFLTVTEDLVGKTALDVGAGGGIDALRLSDAGAHVTAMEYSPSFFRRGKEICPQARWVGGLSHTLPFQDATFDYVFANAALYHMRDPSAAIREMLRVVKVGGSIFTVGDPFRADSSDDRHEFDVFNKHEGVLRGINESIPRFSALYGALAEFSEKLDIKLVCSFDYLSEPLRGAAPIGDGTSGLVLTPNSAENILRLARSHGSLAMSARKLAPLHIPAPTQRGETLLSGGELSGWLGRPSAVPNLLPFIAPEMLDLPFPGRRQSKLELLNGWMKPEPPFDERMAHGRARWFLRRPAFAAVLGFEVRLQSPSRATIQILLNGEEQSTFEIEGRDWHEVAVDLGMVSSPFVAEIRIDRETVTEFDDKCFAVRNRTLG